MGADGDYESLFYPQYGIGDMWSSLYLGSSSSLQLYYWNDVNYNLAYQETGYRNVWSYSALNTVNLNTNYLNNIGSTWSSKIAQHTWEVGENTWENLGRTSVKTAYINEIKRPASATTYSAKVGLMYVSDYGYATNPSYWTTNLNDYEDVSEQNWMYMGLNEWTITRESSSSRYAFSVYVTGRLSNSYIAYSNDNNDRFFGVVRPTFYLNSDVQYISGTGTQSDPFRIA